jgi:hypothetical protein
MIVEGAQCPPCRRLHMVHLQLVGHLVSLWCSQSHFSKGRRFQMDVLQKDVWLVVSNMFGIFHFIYGM